MSFITECSDQKNIHITIIGAGLVGLSCLVELLSRARTNSDFYFVINVIEKRNLDFNRGQKIIIIEDESENKGVSWIDFLKIISFQVKV